MESISLAGIVIFYNPNEDTIKNVQTYVSGLDKLWVIDNSENNLKDFSFFSALHPQVEIIQDGVNKGIGERINYALKECLRLGFDWLLTMDQDSWFTESNRIKYISLLGDVVQDNTIGQIGIEHNSLKQEPDANPYYEQTLTLITSGSFVNVNAAFRIGLMNEDLFIDEVDTEFSYRLTVNHFKTILFKGIYLVHNLGEKKLGRSFKSGKKTFRTLHSPFRLYYITRNFLWVRKMYMSDFREHFQERTRQMKHIFKNNILYNPGRIEVIKMICKGYLDYRRNVMGRLNK